MPARGVAGGGHGGPAAAPASGGDVQRAVALYRQRVSPQRLAANAAGGGSGGAAQAGEGSAAIATAAAGATGTGAGVAGAAGRGLTGSGGGAALDAVKAVMQRSPIAADVLARLEQGGARVTVLDDAQFKRRFPGAAGIFNPNSDEIVLPRSGLADATSAALTLTHEGIHWLQDRIGNANLARSGGALGDAIAGARAFGNPRGSRDEYYHDEAQSYVIESITARQLGVRDKGYGTDPSTGATRSYNDTLQRVRNSPFYN